MANNLFQNIKPLIWPPVKARIQKYKIESELKNYKAKAKDLGIDESLLSDRNYVKGLLEQRFHKRGLKVTKKKKGDLHIVYLSCMDHWERVNMPPALEQFGKLTIFNTDEHGYRIRDQIYPENWIEERRKLNDKLFNFVNELHSEEPVDIVISYLSGYHLLPGTIKKINSLGIVTSAFWLDDKLSFKGRYDGEVYKGAASVASSYDLNLTSATSSIIKYFVENGLAIFWPEGANPDYYKPIDLPKIFDVSFIGARYGARGEYIEFLRKNNIQVTAFGAGWENGFVESRDMSRIYSQSKINIGFGGIGYSMEATCLKGRDFEVPMSGTVYLTTFDEDLEKVFRLGEHIFTYHNKEEMLEKVKFLLDHPDVCSKARMESRAHCLTNHTWAHRFNELFEITGLI